MKKINKTISALLAGALILAPIATTAFAAESETLSVTASSNFSPSVTQSFDATTQQVTATWWLQDATDKMVNIQGYLTYDKTKLSVDMTDGVNRSYNASEDEYTEKILCITGGTDTVVNYQPKTLPDSANAAIRFNATAANGFSMGDAANKVPFFSVTFNPVSRAEGSTDVHLEVEYMAVRSPGDTTYHKLIHRSEIVDTSAQYLPDEIPSAVYAGPYDPDYQPEEPTTAEPTTLEPTTAAPTTVAPTTIAPTTVAPTTIAPTTVAPTTVAPTTVAPTTVAPTTVAPTTVAPTTVAPTTIAPTTIAPTTIAPTTIAPTTIAPTTVAPTTIAPTTVAPTTNAPTTVAPTTIAPTTIAPTSVEPTTIPHEDYLLGDVNGDGKIDVNDATLNQLYSAELTKYDARQLLAGDVNKDGTIDVMDVTLIQMYAAEIIRHF